VTKTHERMDAARSAVVGRPREREAVTRRKEGVLDEGRVADAVGAVVFAGLVAGL
jgi:hypothetical protein